MTKREGYILLACVALLTIAEFVVYFCLYSEIKDINEIQHEKLICLPRIYEKYEGDMIYMQCAPESIFNSIFEKEINEIVDNSNENNKL